MPLNVIAQLKTQISGELVDRGRVVDNLLDVRLAASEAGNADAIVRAVDELLGELPGNTVVETSWWAEALDRLSDAGNVSHV